MRNIVLILATLVLLSGTVFASGAAPTAPSPFKTSISGSNTYITNTPASSGSSYFIVVVRNANGTFDSLLTGPLGVGSIKYLAPKSGESYWWLGNTDSEWDRVYGDTIFVTATSGRLRIDGDYFYRLDGEGLEASGGLASELRAVLGRDISSPEIVDTTIQPVDLSDTATTWEFEAAYKADATDTVATDSQYATLAYSRKWIAGKPVSGATPSDNYILKFDQALDSFMYEADAGATSGDDIKVDSNGSTAGGVWDAPSGTVIQFGTGLAATKLGSDTISVSASAGAAIELDGDTTNASSTFNWSQAQMVNIDSLHADTITATELVVENDIYGSSVFLASIVDDESDLYTGISLSVEGNTPFKIYDGSTAKWRFERDTLASDVIGGGFIRGVRSISTDSITIRFTNSLGNPDSTVLGGTVAGVRNPGMTARNVRDTVANYVLKTNENWLDYSGDASIQHLSGLNATDVMLRMTRTLSGDDTTTLTTPTGNVKIEAPIAVSFIGGPGNPTLDDTLNMNGYDIIGIQRAYGDTADFTTYLNVPGLSGMTDSIAAVRTDLDSLNSVVGTSYLTATATKTAIGDSLAVRKWEEMSVVSSWVKPLEDSVYLLDNVVLDRGSATPEQYIVLDSAGDIDVSGGSQLDTFFVVGTLPEACVLDSFRYTYKVSGAGVNITSVDLMGPTLGDYGINQCDSIYFTDNTDRTSTSLARIRTVLTNSITVPEGGFRYALRFIVTLPADNAWVGIGYAQLGWK